MALFEKLFNRDLKGTIEDNDRFVIGGNGNPDKNVLASTVKAWILAFTDIVANIAYRNRVKTKVLWTGPLSVVSTPTSLDGVEKFSDWDIVFIAFNLRNDTDISQVTPIPIFRSLGFTQAAIYTAVADAEKLRVNIINDTSFEIVSKTVAQGNISYIVGVSL